ncbi:UNVERIFIED_CONTAM: hypothetical protein GTU68_037786 [Idotea baltica]|nr:hypothetical protein [Idotea baltica]
MGVGFNTGTFLSEEIGQSFSFGVSVAAHTGIGTLPILYYGTDAQKAKYLPGLANGQIKAAYCLTEPGSGSDALSAKTKATLTEDGEHYIIEGQKMWITNSGFADMFIVFAQIDGNKFTGFIIDKGAENLNLGAEEEKLGIKGSSTRQVFLEGVKIPKENILGEIGKGHKIAFNVLNIGRFKLGAMVMGGSKAGCTTSIKYANERIQFGVPIASFGAIQHKLAEQAIQIYACESATYRTSGLIEKKVEEYAIECAIIKVVGSEVLHYVVDETVQVHGGNGFSEEFDAARAYRDARINKIFEGTNEINRLLSVGMLIKKGMKGQLDIMTPAMAIQKELMSVPSFNGNGATGVLSAELKAIQSAKKAFLMVAGSAVQKFMQDLEKQQEIIMLAADVLMDIFTAESTILRTQKLVSIKGEEASSVQIDATVVFVSDALERIFLNGKRAVCGFAEGDELKMMMMGIKRFTKFAPVNTIAARKRVAESLIAANEYNL